MEQTGTGREETNSRREFLRMAFKKTGEVALKGVKLAVERAARGIVRPPGAVGEAEFLAVCTRCGDCVEACPEGALFLLGANAGVGVGTPSLDLVNRACTMCESFPCVASCQPGALQPVAREELRFAEVRIDPNTCLPYKGPECGVCALVCLVPGALMLKITIPEIDRELCTGCAVCRQACPVQPSAISVHPLPA